MSSADSVSRRLTAAPTVPYPSSAIGTSTDASGLLLHVERPQPHTDLLDLRLGEFRTKLTEVQGELKLLLGAIALQTVVILVGVAILLRSLT